MAQGTCSIDGCDSPARTRGWCRIHYQRWYRTGDPLGIRPGKWDGYVRPTCSVDGCDATAHARGLCPSHFCRQRRHGDPLAGRRSLAKGSFNERFLSFVDMSGDCWLWTGGCTTAGYGEFTYDGETMYAHRTAYTLFVGEIPADHHIHHECEVKRCCNPEHLTPLTADEHRRRHAVCPS